MVPCVCTISPAWVMLLIDIHGWSRLPPNAPRQSGYAKGYALGHAARVAWAETASDVISASDVITVTPVAECRDAIYPPARPPAPPASGGGWVEGDRGGCGGMGDVLQLHNSLMSHALSQYQRASHVGMHPTARRIQQEAPERSSYPTKLAMQAGHTGHESTYHDTRQPQQAEHIRMNLHQVSIFWHPNTRTPLPNPPKQHRQKL